MDTISFEEALQLKEISPDTYESIQRPWTWHETKVIPGGILMSLAAAAAYKTVSSDFSINTLQAHFLSGPSPDNPLQLGVQRLSDGGRFVTRVVTVQQAGATMVHITCSFVRTAAMKGPSMEHHVSRATSQTVETITLDDLEPGRSRQGPYMQFERLPIVHNGPDLLDKKPPPQSLIYTSVARISPPIGDNNPHLHALGVLALSDYHILDAPPTLHGLTFGLPKIGDYTRTPTYSHIERFTTLNHNVHFHVHGDFKADELCYIEVTSPWAKERRAEIQSRIFDKGGKLLATCVQEAYFVIKPPKKDSNL